MVWVKNWEIYILFDMKYVRRKRDEDGVKITMLSINLVIGLFSVIWNFDFDFDLNTHFVSSYS